ncbi:MAG: hypothetical protein O8C66_12510 [Candidatus Methanoperedens sp.]|nr:hypothetical protein [Candidatus Methanoperedens sp.]MCZ7371323.1 hypothetical protein [Candidatus Methanoperedens sp.]
MNLRKIIDPWIIISIFIIIILISINIPYTTKEPYTDKEYYTAQEPYVSTETYYEKQPYIDNVPLNLTTTVNWDITDHSFSDEFDLMVSIRNTDNARGEFWVTFHVESTNGSFDFTTDKMFLMPGESRDIKKTFSGRFSYVTYRVYQPTREVTRYLDVPKERTIAGYREVEKSREVVKSNEIKLSLLERILNGEKRL